MSKPCACVAFLLSFAFVPASMGQAGDANGWPEGKTYNLKGLRVTLSAPVLVGRRKSFYWFPKVVRLANGDLIAHASLDVDDFGQEREEVLWSSDGGLTWRDPKQYPSPSNAQVLLTSGDLLFLPYRLYPLPGGMGGPYYLIPNGSREINRVERGITVTGWPRPAASTEEQRQYGQASFVFDGQPVRLKNGQYLVTLNGFFEPPSKKRFKWSRNAFRTLDGQDIVKSSLVAAESTDGLHWKIRSVIADESCEIQDPYQGPNEATLCRLKDGRLMCIFGQSAPYGQTWSSDEGRTWTKPVRSDYAWSVDPRAAVMKDGTVVLSGGRPGVNLWFDASGTGKDWLIIDLVEHHNIFHPQEPLKRFQPNGDPMYYSGTSTGYTEVVAVDDSHILCVYDRTPLSSSQKSATPAKNMENPDLGETYSVWAVRGTLTRN
jgi:hypothetical protein